MRKRILFFKTLTDRIVRNNRGRFLLVLSAFCGLIVFNLLLSDYLVYPGKVVFSGLFGFIIVASQLGLAYLFGVNRGIWKYSSISDLILIVKVAAVSFALNIVSMLVTGLGHDALRILLVDHMLFVLSFGGLRLLVRLYRNVGPVPSTLKRVLIVGAGDGGDIACRRVKHDTTQYEVVGFLDDDPWKKNHEIHGVKVLGATHQIVEIVQANEVNEVVIAIPSAGPALLRSLAEKCFEAKAQVKIMPSLSELSENSATFEIRNLKLEDLLAREPIIEDLSSVRKTYVNKRVLVTGAAGSIGEELVKQVAQMGPAIVYLLDQAESPLYFLFRECQVKFPNVEFVPMLCDITDHWALGRFFKQAQPQIVLHAAAYKHVPILEDNIYQAISVNVEGTKKLAELSKEHGVERFVFISTDKAVNPTNILGVTKRMAELLCKVFQENSKTKFIAVRFGNVIGSQGSVIPLFTKQIQQGGPITVTHPDIKRYFMMIPEAVQLVLFASVLGNGGEIFVLDMGKQVKIMDLAVNMIRLCGFEPNTDIKIEFCGLRPGEKLYEELYDETEKVCPTKHPKINMAIGSIDDSASLLKNINECAALSKQDGKMSELYKLLKRVVTTYQLAPSLCDEVIKEKNV